LLKEKKKKKFLLCFAIHRRNEGVVTYGIRAGSTRDLGFATAFVDMSGFYFLFSFFLSKSPWRSSCRGKGVSTLLMYLSLRAFYRGQGCLLQRECFLFLFQPGRFPDSLWAWFEISLGALLYILGDFNGFLCMNWGCKNLRFDYDRRF
jgi:hypothetical protein